MANKKADNGNRTRSILAINRINTRVSKSRVAFRVAFYKFILFSEQNFLNNF